VSTPTSVEESDSPAVEEAAPAEPTTSGPSFRLSFSPITKPSLGRFSDEKRHPTVAEVADEVVEDEAAEDEAAEDEVVEPEVVEPEDEVVADEAVADEAVEPEPVVEEPEPEPEPVDEEPEPEPEPVDEEPEPEPEPEPQPEPEPEPEPEPGPAEHSAAFAPGSARSAARLSKAPKALASDVALSVRNLTKRFGRTIAVDSADLEIKTGAFYGFVGPNGAGKTTTLRMLSSLVEPDAGRALVDGIDVRARPQEALRRLGMLPDSRGLYPRLTAREHLAYFGGLQGLARGELEQRTQELAELLDLRELLDRRVAGFSQGERTKVAIARALVHWPHNVVLDEATNGLDVMSTRAMRAVIRKLAEAGKCVLFSSHVMQEVSALCDQIVVFARGKVVSEGTPDELRARTGEDNLENAFVKIIGSDVGLE
jgi:sodium transport system ATP-binding protein